MSTFARFDTTEGSFTIRLFDQEVPKTVANFVALAQGTKQWTDPDNTGKIVMRPLYKDVPPVPPHHRRFHVPVWRSAGHRLRWAGLHAR